MTVQVEALTYEALKAQCDALADRVERLSGMLTESRVATKSAEERADALAVRNERLTAFLTEGFNIAGKGGSWCGGDIQELGEKLGLFARETYQPALHGYHCGHEPGEDSVYVITNSATDAALAAIRLEAKIEGANELAERIAEMHSKTAPGSNIEKKLMFAAEAAIAYANGLREAN
ncbi:hypothetical protein [Serratia marcescens]|uniref:hypothetical protein n=1 Tax=Serratia marcescens TaxID=615 RepID=UPI001F154BC6|nr:hypothetical protein [Serratia marcescens]